MIEQLLNNTFAPYILTTRYAPGLFNLARGTNMQTKYDIDVWKQLLYRKDKWMSLQMQAILDHLSKILLGKEA